MDIDNLEIMKDLNLTEHEQNVDDLIKEGKLLQAKLRVARELQVEARQLLREALDNSNKADNALQEVDYDWTNNQLTRQKLYEKTQANALPEAL